MYFMQLMNPLKQFNVKKSQKKDVMENLQNA